MDPNELLKMLDLNAKPARPPDALTPITNSGPPAMPIRLEPRPYQLLESGCDVKARN